MIRFLPPRKLAKGWGWACRFHIILSRDFGGRLVAENHPEGGAVFTIRAQTGQPANARGGAMKDAQILFVDDEEHLRLSSTQALELEGLAVRSFSSARDVAGLR